jgi:uncharacterized protein YceK
MKAIAISIVAIFLCQGCANVMKVDTLVIPLEQKHPIFIEPKSRSI